MMLSNVALLIFQVNNVIHCIVCILNLYGKGLLCMIIIESLSPQIIGMSHIFSNSHPRKARVMVWVLAGLSTLAG